MKGLVGKVPQGVEYKEYRVFTDIKGLRESVEQGSKYEVVVLADGAGGVYEIGVEIGRIKELQGGCRWVYVGEGAELVVGMYVTSIGGFVTTDSGYLLSEEDLDELVQMSEGGGELLVVEESGVSKEVGLLKDFINSYMSGDIKIQSEYYLKTVTRAMGKVDEYLAGVDLMLERCGRDVDELFVKVCENLSTLQKRSRDMEVYVSNLKKTIGETQQRSVTLGQGITIFPPYEYRGMGQVLLIREYGPCKYLTSFLLAFRGYLHMQRNKKVKLIFVYQKGEGVNKRYTSIPTITFESEGVEGLYVKEVVGTNTPKHDVMEKLLGGKEELYIVVDRVYGSQDIVRGHRVKRLNAVSGLGDIQRNKLEKEKSISSVVDVGGYFCIPTLENYRSAPEYRDSWYYTNCKSEYDKLEAYIYGKE